MMREQTYFDIHLTRYGEPYTIQFAGSYPTDMLPPAAEWKKSKREALLEELCISAGSLGFRAKFVISGVDDV